MGNRAVMSATVNTKAFTLAMKALSKEAFPSAMADTLNQTADAVTKQQIKNVKESFTIRTQFTLRSMESKKAKPYKALNKATGKDIRKMFSRVGTFSKYLWKQEDGGRFTGKNGIVPIATIKARTSKSLAKAIAKRHRLKASDNVSKNGTFTGASGYSRHFIGTPKGGKMMGGPRRRGLYERSGNNKKLTMLRNLESRSIRIKKTGFHSRAIKQHASNRHITARFCKNARNEIRKVGRRYA